MKKTIMWILCIFLLNPLVFGKSEPRKLDLRKDSRAMRREIELQIPKGSSLKVAEQIMEANGFRCASFERTLFAEMDENKRIVEHPNINFLDCQQKTGFLFNTRILQVALAHEKGLRTDVLVSLARIPILRKKDYKALEDVEIRSVLIKFAPPGSSESEVRKVLSNLFHRHLKKYDGYYSIPKNFVTGFASEDYVLRSRLQNYDYLQNFFLSINYVESYWLFDKNGILKDVGVQHLWDGV